MHILPVLLACLLLGGCAADGSFRPYRRGTDAPLLSTPPARGAFAQLDGTLSIRGGWGYGPTDAFILSMPSKSRQKNHNTIPTESRLVRARNEAEFSTTPAPGHRHRIVDYGTITRTLKTRGNRMFAVWKGEVRLIPEAGSPELPASSDSGTQARRVIREYWFDITDAALSNGGASGERGQTMSWPKNAVWAKP